jgi:hypothetical protein
VYALLAVPVTGLVMPSAGGQVIELPMLFQSALRAAASTTGFFPDNMYYSDWQFWLSGYSTNALILSFSLVILWNIIYSPNMLGRNRERSARLLFVVFLILHAASQLALLFFYFTTDIRMWQFVTSKPVAECAVLFIPQLLVVPFIASVKAFCPYRIYHMFPVFVKVRAALGLRVYSHKKAV